MDETQALFVHDTRHIISVNQAACKLFRCDAVELVDLDMMELITNEDFRGLARLRMRMLREHGHAPKIKYPFRRCDGSMFWATVTSEKMSGEQFMTIVTYEYEA